MNKYIKLFSAVALFSILALVFSSCLDDDKYYSNYWESIVTVNKIGENTYDFTLDNGKKLWIAAPSGLNLRPKYDRAIIGYTKLTGETNGYDHNIELLGFYDVLTKAPIYIAKDDQVKQDSIGHNPIEIYSLWEGGGYLNINHEIRTFDGGLHMLNLVSSEPDLSVNSDTIKLEFRHNRKDTPEYYPAKGYVSFDLAPFKIEGRDKVVLEISWEKYNGESRTKTVEYKYNESGSNDVDISDQNNITNLNIY